MDGRTSVNDTEFRASIIADPASDEPRLVYADWLEEQNDPRGEFIRIQCDFERRDRADPKRWDLLERESELLTEYEDDWLGDLESITNEPRFRRGFCDSIIIDAVAFPELAGKIFETEPITVLCPNDISSPNGKQAAVLASCPELRHIRKLELAGLDYTSDDLRQLAGSHYLTALDEIAESFVVGLPTASAIARSEDLRERLKTLHLTLDANGNLQHFDGLWPQLETLNLYFETNCRRPELSTPRLTDLSINHFGSNVRWHDLLANLNTEGVTRLTLFGGHVSGPFTSDCIQSLHDNGCLAQLKTLDLGYSELQFDAIRRLCSGTNLHQAESIMLDGDGLSVDVTTEFANHFTCGQLRRLELSNFDCDSAAALALANAAGLAGLYEFSLFGAAESGDLLAFKNSSFRSSIRKLNLPITEAETVHELFSVPWPELNSLDLNGCSLKQADLQRLLDFGSLPNLRQLSLSFTGLGPSALMSIAASTNCAGLREVGFERNAATIESVRALLEACPKLNFLDLHDVSGLDGPVPDDLSHRVVWPEQK